MKTEVLTSIKDITDFISNTKGAKEALSFHNKYVQPYLESISQNDSEEQERMKAEIICVNPNCDSRQDLTFHHFYAKVYRHDHFRKKEIKGRQGGVLICHKCHRFLHSKKTNKELFESYITKESIINYFKTSIVE